MNTDQLVQDAFEMLMKRIVEETPDDITDAEQAGIIGETCMHAALRLSSFALQNLSDRQSISSGMLIPEDNLRFELTISKSSTAKDSKPASVLSPTGPKSTDSIN